jgi:hypothetical protein
VDRPEVTSHGVAEGEVLAEVLGSGGLTGDREADLVAAIQRLEDLSDRIPLLWRVLYHGLYQQYKPQNEDVWLRVGVAASRDPEEVRDKKWRHKIKSQAWRWAHPAGLEVEPPE